MTKVVTIIIIGFQFLVTFIVTVSIYMIYALLDSNFGIDGLFGIIFIQPIMGVILTFLTIFVCTLFGLPIRLNKKLNNWWTKNFYISILGIVCGLSFLVIAFLPNLKDLVSSEIDGQLEVKSIPNSFFTLTGWFLTAFSFLHLYPPKQLTDKIINLLQKDFDKSELHSFKQFKNDI